MSETKPPLPPDDLNEPEVEAEIEAPAPAQRPTPPVPDPSAIPAPPPAAPAAPMAARSYAGPMDKSPGLALFLSIFFPGLGHIYVGSYERAVMIIGGIGVSIWGMVVTDGRLWPLAFAIAFSYFFAIFDAYREAQIANLAADEEPPKPRREGQGRLLFGIFLTVVAGLVLADNLGIFDLDWFEDWWPALVLVVGVYFIGSWIWEKMQASKRSSDSSFD